MFWSKARGHHDIASPWIKSHCCEGYWLKSYFHPNSNSLWCIAQTSYLISETLPDTNVNGRDSHECNNINFTWILWSLHILQLWFKSFNRSQLRRTAWITPMECKSKISRQNQITSELWWPKKKVSYPSLHFFWQTENRQEFVSQDASRH